jgi:hypothetical protein
MELSCPVDIHATILHRERLGANDPPSGWSRLIWQHPSRMKMRQPALLDPPGRKTWL